MIHDGILIHYISPSNADVIFPDRLFQHVNIPLQEQFMSMFGVILN